MNPCPTNEELSAFHDGRVMSPRAAVIEQHLLDCEPCQAELGRLRAISRLFAALPRPQLSQMTRYRLHERADAAMERGLIRFQWGLSGIAASILMIGSIWLMQSNTKSTVADTTPPWVAVTNAVDNEQVAQSATTPVAQWYLADASSSSSDTP